MLFKEFKISSHPRWRAYPAAKAVDSAAKLVVGRGERDKGLVLDAAARGGGQAVGVPWRLWPAAEPRMRPAPCGQQRGSGRPPRSTYGAWALPSVGEVYMQMQREPKPTSRIQPALVASLTTWKYGR